MVLRPSPPRRYLAYGCLLFLGILLIYLAFVGSPEFGYRILLALLGMGSLAGAEALRRATLHSILLTDDGLEEEGTGRLIAHLDQIETVDRGLFAFKPSNGFAIRLKEPSAGAWAPGLWWRYGRRVGIGGVVSKPHAAAVAETLAQMTK